MDNISTWLDNMAEATGKPVNSSDAKRLMQMIHGIESNFGTDMRPNPKSTASGPFQILDSTRDWLENDYLPNKQPAMSKYISGLPAGAERDLGLARTKLWSKEGGIPTTDKGKHDYYRENYFGGTKGFMSYPQARRRLLGKYGKQEQAGVAETNVLINQPMGTPESLVLPIDTRYKQTPLSKIDKFRSFK